jgi:cold shock CspA family protein
MNEKTVEVRHGFFDYWNEMRGFGFCKVEGEEGRYFAHASNVVSGTPNSGLAATFEVGTTSRGPCAVNIHVLRGGL